MSSFDKALQYLETGIKRQWDYFDELSRLIKIPSVSANPEHKGDVRSAAQVLGDQLMRMGFPKVKIIESHIKDGNPLVYGEWYSNASFPTVLFYGHYDVQPAEPLEKWSVKPFELSIGNGNIYARGVADDKGQIFIWLKAIEAFVRGYNGNPPVNIKVIIEGEEEVNGKTIEHFVQDNSNMLASDFVVVCDTSMVSTEVPCLTYGLRGIVYYELTFSAGKTDLHSGEFGGVAPNPLKDAARFIFMTEPRTGYPMIPDFKKDVRVLTPFEKILLMECPFPSEKEYLKESGFRIIEGPSDVSIPEKIGAQPTIEVHGIIGGYMGEGAKTVIPAEAKIKMSIRLVPDQDATKIDTLFRNWVADFAGKNMGSEITIKELGRGRWWVADTEHPVYEKARIALMKGFNTSRTAGVFAGGSIPIVSVFADSLKCPVVLMGFGLPGDNLHAPNENFAIARLWGGMRTVLYFLEEIKGENKQSCTVCS